MSVLTLSIKNSTFSKTRHLSTTVAMCFDRFQSFLPENSFGISIKKFETSLDIMVFDERVICKIIFTVECFWIIVDDLLSKNKFNFRIVFDKIRFNFGPLRRRISLEHSNKEAKARDQRTIRHGIIRYWRQSLGNPWPAKGTEIYGRSPVWFWVYMVRSGSKINTSPSNSWHVVALGVILNDLNIFLKNLL